MKMPDWARSVRFRLSLLYSSVLFLLAGTVIVALYLSLRRALSGPASSAVLVRPGLVKVGDLFVEVQVPVGELVPYERAVNEHALDLLQRFSLLGLAGVFLVSLLVGWVVSGRALRPVGRIATVAADIEATDLSRRIRLEGPDDELTRLARTFDAMLERLETAFAAQRRFLADTSHDLRNPLQVIRTNIEVALAGPDVSADEWRATAQIVSRSAERMGRMIDDLLAVARLQIGTAVRVELDLAPLVVEAVEESRAAATSARVALATSAAPTLVRGDRVSLARALGNLVENAVRASPPGASVELASGIRNGWAWLAVRDHGPGFDHLPGESRGLGLSIVRQIAEAHSGQLAVFSEHGNGSTAVVWIPTGGVQGSPPASSPLTAA